MVLNPPHLIMAQKVKPVSNPQDLKSKPIGGRAQAGLDHEKPDYAVVVTMYKT